MSRFTNVCAVLPVLEHTTAIAWYTRWIGRGPDVEPTEGVAEWQLADNAWIQVAQAPDGAGTASTVIGVDDIDGHVSDLADAGVSCGEIQDLGFIKLADLVDPAGNTISFVWENPDFQPPSE